MKKSKSRPSTHQHRVFQLVRRGYLIQLQIAQLSEQLKPIEEILRAEARKRPFKHSMPEGDTVGEADWSARAAGAECRVIFPGPQLQEVFAESHPELPTIRRICGPRFSQLFTESLQVRITDPVAFRQQVTHLFTPHQGGQLLRLCSVLPESTVVWSNPASAKGKASGKGVLP
jgi:hypothetical protein